MKFEKVESFQSDNGQLTTRYYLMSLEKGQGITIGNALRRVLLTDLEGTAISEVQIYGINSEYGSIPGVREDVLEILLNLKQIKIQGILETPITGTIDILGPCLITAKTIKLPNNLRIINGNQYIATVSSNSSLNLKLTIKSGKGYHLSGEHPQSQMPEFFGIDAIFTPVINVSFNLKDIYQFEEKGFENLELVVTTNGSITPDEALVKAAEKLTELFASLVVCEPKMSLPSETETTRETLIEELQLSVRAYNCLKRVNIRTINDLKKYSIKELKEIKNFGDKCANELIWKMRDRFDIILE